MDYSFLVEKGSKFKKTQRTKSGRLIDANLEWEIRVLNNKTYGVFTVTNITPHDPHKNQFLVNSNYQKNYRLFEFIIDNSYVDFLVLDENYYISYASPNYIREHSTKVVGQNFFEYLSIDIDNNPIFLNIKKMNKVNDFLLIEHFEHKCHVSLHGKKLINIYCYYMGISKEQKILIKTRDYTEVEYYKRNYQKLEKSTAERHRLILLGEALAGIAHEINNPLTAILTNAQLLQRKQESREINRIAREALRISKIIKSLLFFSQHSQIKGRVNVREQLEDVLVLLNTKINENYEILIDIPEEIEVLGNSVEFSQILFNLIRNALEALEKAREKKIEIKAKTIGDSVEIFISDTGCGIPEKNLEKIFEPFFSSKKSGKGTGIGLSMVYFLANKINGQIRVTSQENIGTTFKLIFPKYKTLNKGQWEVSLQDKKILVIDEDEMFLEAVEEMFSSEGSYLIKEKDAIKGFQMIMENEYDLLLISTKMPFLNGVEIYKALYNNGYDVNKIILLLDRNDEMEMLELCKDIKSKFIHKPFTLEEIKECIQP